jgi:para-nitrobenzyl esterase
MIRITKTESGMVKGLPAADPRITVFKGIPFAAPPVGNNRWRAPQPCTHWDGIYNAYEYGPISVQDTPGLGTDIYCREWHVDPDIPMSEDCLYLNIWTGATHPDDKLPVVVWFFGGAFQWGYTAEMEFDGERLARRGIVVVTVNYRLNLFGFLAHPELTAEQEDSPTNFGHLDQRAGLLWVIRNISHFGGDPGNITIAGQSAGGMSVMVQLTNPANFGLFQKAIVQSGMIQSPYPHSFFGSPPSLKDAETQGAAFFSFLGVRTLSEARQLDAKYLLRKYNEFVQTHPRMMTVFDNNTCYGNPLYLYMKGRHAHVPLLTGNTLNEFIIGITAASEAAYRMKVTALFGDKAEQFLRCPEAWNHHSEIGYAPINTIEYATKSVLLENQVQGGTEPCYYYQFMPDIPGWDNPGAFHSSELWFFFETLAKCWRPFKGYHYDLARKMCNYWANFVKHGDPNGMDHDGVPLPQWKPYGNASPYQMLFESAGPKLVLQPESEFTKLLIERLTHQILNEEGNKDE